MNGLEKCLYKHIMESVPTVTRIVKLKIKVKCCHIQIRFTINESLLQENAHTKTEEYQNL